jgi:hypothetical protein
LVIAEVGAPSPCSDLLSTQRGERWKRDLDGAIDVVEQLEPTTYSAVSLAEVYFRAGRLDDVLELTEGLKNEDECPALRVPSYCSRPRRHRLRATVE